MRGLFVAKICKNCSCFEVCMFANPHRTEDCNINWQPIITYCEACEHWDLEHKEDEQGWCPKVVGYRRGSWYCGAGKRKVINER